MRPQPGAACARRVIGFHRGGRHGPQGCISVRLARRRRRCPLNHNPCPSCRSGGAVPLMLIRRRCTPHPCAPAVGHQDFDVPGERTSRNRCGACDTSPSSLGARRLKRGALACLAIHLCLSLQSSLLLSAGLYRSVSLHLSISLSVSLSLCLSVSLRLSLLPPVAACSRAPGLCNACEVARCVPAGPHARWLGGAAT